MVSLLLAGTLSTGSAAIPAVGRYGSAWLARTPRTTGPYVVTQYSSFQGDGGNDGLAITTDTRPQPGDQLLLTFCNASSIVAPTPPAGWYEIPVTDTDFTGPFQARHYLLANPAASTTYTWTGVISTRRTMIGLLIRGGVLESGEAHATSSVSSHVTPTLQSAGPNRLAIAACCLRGFPTDAWIENQAGNWDERLQVVGADATTNAQVSMQNKPVGAGAVSDTFSVTTPEDVIIGLFLFGPGIPSRAPTVIPAPPGPRFAGTAMVMGSRTDPTAAAQDFPPRTIITLATARPPVGSAFVLPRFDVEDVAPPRQVTVTAVRPSSPPGSAQIVAPHTDITPDTPCPAPILSTGQPAAVLPGAAVLAGSRTDPAAASTNSCPQLTVTTGRPPAVAGGTVLAGPRTDPTPDTPTPQPLIVAGKTGPPSAGGVALAGPRTDPPTAPDAPCPQPIVAFRPIPARFGTAVLTYTRTDITPDTLPSAPVIAPVRRPPGPATSILLRSTFTAPLIPGDTLRPPIIASGLRLATSGWVFIQRTVDLAGHSCSTPRPSTGTTSRPSAGITAYNPATTARPSTGTTARPNTGTTVDPC